MSRYCSKVNYNFFLTCLQHLILKKQYPVDCFSPKSNAMIDLLFSMVPFHKSNTNEKQYNLFFALCAAIAAFFVVVVCTFVKCNAATRIILTFGIHSTVNAYHADCFFTASVKAM